MPFYHFLMMEPEFLPKASTEKESDAGSAGGGRMSRGGGDFVGVSQSLKVKGERWSWGTTLSPPSRLLFSQSYL